MKALWDEVRFEELYLIPSRNGLNRPKAVRGKGFKMINMGEIFAHDRLYDIDMELVLLNDREKGTHQVFAHDLIFARQSIVAEGAGKCSIVMSVSNMTCFESHIIRVRLNNEKSLPLFYYYYFQSELGKGFLASIRQQGVQAGIRGTDLAKSKIPLPPLSTQQKIARILSAYDDLIENNLKRIKLLEEMAQITYEQWFVRMKFPGHETTPIDAETGLPEGWKNSRLRDVLVLNYGKALKADNRKVGTVPVYGSAGIVGSHDESIVDGPGVIVGRKGNVGSVFWSNTRFFPIDTVFYVTSELPLLFVFFLLKYIEFINNDAAVPGLNRNAAYMVKIKIPPLALIRNFSEYVGRNFQGIEILSQQNHLLKEARDILLPRLMTGMIDVDEIELPHISAL